LRSVARAKLKIKSSGTQFFLQTDRGVLSSETSIFLGSPARTRSRSSHRSSTLHKLCSCVCARDIDRTGTQPRANRSFWSWKVWWKSRRRRKSAWISSR